MLDVVHLVVSVSRICRRLMIIEALIVHTIMIVLWGCGNVLSLDDSAHRGYIVGMYNSHRVVTLRA